MAAMEEEGIERILVVDLDVHQVWAKFTWTATVPEKEHPTNRCNIATKLLFQGNGTSAIFSSDERVTTFDVHGAPESTWSISPVGSVWALCVG
jgi:hypothetical protein